ncbi:unnamed protein product [Paramecium primaurelia]|uniref:Uncharacterized protein n=1 Tax=Paramecium primaurelia TaxID=5886 RepID=A0A8S1LKT1_PARPR|nr:unnamed protein product [Paramecium primaurelia]
MKQALLVLAIICLGFAGHNIRHHKQNTANSQKSLVQTQEIQYIDDDKSYQEPAQTTSNEAELVQETQIQQEQTEQQQLQEQQESEINLTTQEQDQLDLEEQRKYEEEKQKQLQSTKGSDDDFYMNALNVEIQTQDQSDQMPVDVVENQLNPVFEKDPIPDQKGVDSPFQPADGSLMINPEEPEYEIKQTQLMPDEIPAEQLQEYMEKIEAQEAQEMAILAAQGPK